MTTFVIRPASIRDVSSIVEVRIGALTEEEISGFSVPENNLYSSIEKLRKMWDRKNWLKDGFEVFVPIIKKPDYPDMIVEMGGWATSASSLKFFRMIRRRDFFLKRPERGKAY